MIIIEEDDFVVLGMRKMHVDIILDVHNWKAYELRWKEERKKNGN